MGNDKIWECLPIYFELRTNQKLTGFDCPSVDIHGKQKSELST